MTDEETDVAESCTKEQLLELQMLQSIYDKDELVFDTDCLPVGEMKN